MGRASQFSVMGIDFWMDKYFQEYMECLIKALIFMKLLFLSQHHIFYQNFPNTKNTLPFPIEACFSRYKGIILFQRKRIESV